MVHDIISNIVVLVKIAALGFAAFCALLAFLNPRATWPYRIASTSIMLGLAAIPLSMLIWPDLFAEVADMKTGPLPSYGLDYS